jgi:sec-independent protein translocase protein TatB
MEILGIGPSEFVFVIIIALIVLGPRDMQKAGRTIGQWLNKLVKSDGWKVFQQTSRELRNLPTNLMREANVDLKQTEDDIRRAIDPRRKPPASSPSPNLPPSEKTDTSVQGDPPIINTPESKPESDQHD